ncbi:2-succinyl-5-enolpyruvyl-6-hydroxy-3-cyclohexene-1-carboxylate synthase, partial [Streptomonospora algeriensis]
VERGVVVCGDGDYDPIPFLALAAETGWPLLAEPTSNARRGEAVSAYRHLLASPRFLAEHTPELAVTAGRPGLSRQMLAYLRRAERHVAVGTPRSFADPVRTATDVVPAVAAPAGARPDTAWARSWQEAEGLARAAIDKILDAEEALSELRLARDLAAQAPNGSLLFAGSSMP